jgi:chromosome segregation ATPase
MKRSPTQPSRRLLAAAAAERAEIQKQREALAARRHALQAQIDDLDAEIAELEERTVLLDRLAGAAEPSDDTITEKTATAPTDKIVLRGPAIRRAAAGVLLSDARRLRAMHYRDWFAMLEQNGYTVAGKDPVAVFLTQLSRSPVIHRGTQSGIYEINLDAVDQLTRQLDNRQRELRALTSAADTADLTSIRARRTSLTREIDKLEKALTEARSTLGRAAPELAAVG